MKDVDGEVQTQLVSMVVSETVIVQGLILVAALLEPFLVLIASVSLADLAAVELVGQAS